MNTCKRYVPRYRILFIKYNIFQVPFLLLRYTWISTNNEVSFVEIKLLRTFSNILFNKKDEEKWYNLLTIFGCILTNCQSNINILTNDVISAKETLDLEVLIWNLLAQKRFKEKRLCQYLQWFNIIILLLMLPCKKGIGNVDIFIYNLVGKYENMLIKPKTSFICTNLWWIL